MSKKHKGSSASIPKGNQSQSGPLEPVGRLAQHLAYSP